MSDTKWTPGPWYETKSGGFIRGEKGRPVASVYGDDPECERDERMDANCALIVAAPDLYDALCDMVSDHESISHGTLDFARRALAKARGESNG